MGIEMKQLLDQISSLPTDWHLAGTMSGVVLGAIAAQAEKLGPVQHSAETGSGKSTLLFSHLSAKHEVFALDAGDSISRVKSSHLFNSSAVKFIEGPSQLTLPRHVFEEKLQVVLVDGPHGYPFPDLEYYYFYPHIAVGGLLLIDDINIPSIKSMFEIIRAGDMFELVQVVEYTAFLRRTEAPLIDPLSDSWWLQGANRAHYEYSMALAQHPPSSRLQIVSRLIPGQLKRLVPQSWKKGLWKAWVRLTGS
jgi:Methyltransferase domain